MKKGFHSCRRLARRYALTGGVLAAVACSDASAPTVPHAALDATALSVLAQPIELQYMKVETGNQTGMWSGRIWGDLFGSSVVPLGTQVYDLRVAGPVWHIKTYWTVEGGTRAFRAELTGTVNTQTGALVLNGTIVSGFLAGARVHNEGTLTQVLGSGATVFEGSFVVFPASGD